MTEQVSKLRVEIDSRNERQKVRALRGDLDTLTASGDKATAQMSILSRSLGVAAGAFAAATAGFGVGQIVRDLSSLEQINSRIGNLTGDLANQQRFLRDTAKELSAEYRTLADGYSRLLPLYDAGILSLKEAQEVTRLLADAQAATGASNENLGGAIFGLSQFLASGTANMEDYRQVVDRIPGLNTKVAESFGVTVAELKELISSGNTLSNTFKGPLLQALRGYEGSAAALSGNIEQTFNRTKNAYLEAVEVLGQPIAAGAVEGAEALTATLKLIEENAGAVQVGITGIGAVLAASLGSAALRSVGTYGNNLVEAGQKSIFFANAERQAAVAANQSAASRLNSAQATRDYTALKLREAQVQNASLTGLRRLTFSTTELAAAEKALATSTAQVAAAQQVADGTAKRLTVANAAATRSAQALAVAQRAASGALALIGGPTGAALLAGGGLIYLATRQSEGEQAAKALKIAVDELSESFFSNSDAAQQAGDAQIEAAKRTIDALNADIAAIQGRFTVNAIRDFFDDRQVEQFREAIRDAYDEIDRIQGLIDRQTDLANTVQPFDLQAIADAAEIFDLVGTRAESARAVLEKLIPDDAKRAQLDDYARQLEEALQVKSITPEEFERGSAAIDEQRRKLGNYAEAARAAERAAKELQSIVAEALPEETAIDEQARKLALLDAAYREGGENADLYRRAIAGLEEQFRQDEAEKFADSIRDVKEALEERAATPFSQYRDEIELLNRAIAELPDEAGNLAGNLQRAFANLDFEIRAELTTVQGSSPEELRQSYQSQRDALAEFHVERQVSEEQAQKDLVDLARSYGDQVIDTNRGIQQRLLELSDASQGARFDFEIQGDTLELDALLRDQEITREQHQQAVEAMSASHQERLSEIVRSGEFTRQQFEDASFADKLAGLQEKYAAEIDLATNFIQDIASTESSRQQRQADEAAAVAQDDAKIYEDALRRFEENGTERNKLALEQAAERAQISEAEARKQFEDQKDANIAQARIAQGLAVAQALSSTGNFLVNIGLAATAAYKTQEAIDSIKAQQFKNGTDFSASSGGTSAGGTSVARPDALNQSAAPQATIVNIINSGFLPLSDTDEVIAESFKRLNDNKLVSDSNGNPLNTDNIQTQNYTF